ncbi:MAG: nucleotidyl transferase AbiEii/AbiGii toxin family protein [Chloroflexi bacterium]|nr:nucleotidyl transferase AbiEii/AbiGii toxin family protein [Chloroflexota bacterium]
MTELYWNTISHAMKEIKAEFGRSDLAEKFYLAGGTALALQLGHRQSIDLDFFTQNEDISISRQQVEVSLPLFHPLLVDSSWGNFIFLINSIRVGFFTYGYPLIAPLIDTNGIQLASLADIGLMKMDALLRRASRKDFHDLYAICQIIPLQDLLILAPQRYPGIRDFEAKIIRHLVFFERADLEAPIPLLQQVSWEEVKDFFRQQGNIISKSWIK